MKMRIKLYISVCYAAFMLNACTEPDWRVCDVNGYRCPSGKTCTGDGTACIDVGQTCGNGVINPGEACDDGNVVGGDDCSSDCSFSSLCGNGVVESDKGEVCDDENNFDYDNCSANCLSDETCGNGYKDLQEGCDDGNLINGDGCGDDCILETCGNGEFDPGEVCDDGNKSSGDGCSADCYSNEICGNGYQDIGEECDTSGDSATCDNDCTAAWCGDGTVNVMAGETCDGMVETEMCDWDCTRAECGDGLVNASRGEECDDESGETATCDLDCTVAWCGDGRVNAIAGETCDDGNDDDLDHCSSTCQLKPRIIAGARHTCVLLNTGVVRCWGRGSSGQLGYGNTSNIGDNEAPASAGDVDLGGSAVQLVAGTSHTCALLDTGGVRCWGLGIYGQLGYGNTDNIGDNETPASAGDVNIGGPVAQIAADGHHTCAVLETGAVRCWGRGVYGQLGYGNTNNIGDNESPASAGDVNVGAPVVQIAVGTEHTCAVLDTGAVRCWGDGIYGQLGYGNTNNIGDNETPASAGNVFIGGSVAQVAAGNRHTCARLDTGGVRCWGGGDDGQLGYGNTNNIGDDETPASAGDVDVGGSVVWIAVDGTNTCGLLPNGAIRCWGDGSSGELGYGNTNNIGDDETPAIAGDVDVGGSAIQLTVGTSHTCAVLDTGTVRCWGLGSYGRLGYGNTNNIGDNETPASAGDVNVGGSFLGSVSGANSSTAIEW